MLQVPRKRYIGKMVANPKFCRAKEVILEDGTVAIHGDFYPVVPVKKRNPIHWTKDPQLKEAKKHVDNSQAGTNYLVQSFLTILKDINMNLSITVGKQRL